MYKIDDLITKIYTDEAIEIPGELTGDQKKKIEGYMNTLILESESSEQEVIKKSDNLYIRRKIKFIRNKKMISLIAAILVLTLGFTVFAAKQNEWDITLTNFMGLNESDTLQLEGGEVIIDKVVTSTWVDYAEDEKGEEKQISITGITSIGDKNSAYLRVNTDYELPESFDEATDYILPENHRVDITYNNIFGHEKIRTFGSVFTAFYENGKLGFLVSIENCKELNRCNVSLEIENLCWYHDLGQYEETDESEPEEMLAEGKWKVDWKYAYESNVITKKMWKRFATEEGTIYLTEIEISPISVRMEVIRNPKDREKDWTIGMLEEIQYEDGTTIEINKSSSGGIHNGIFIDEFTNAYFLGKVLRPEEIDYLVIYGKKVEF